MKPTLEELEKPTMAKPILRFRSTGRDVRELKSVLCVLEYLKKGDVNDRFDLLTKAALELFQEDEGLEVDGVCGPSSWDALNKSVARLG